MKRRAPCGTVFAQVVQLNPYKVYRACICRPRCKVRRL